METSSVLTTATASCFSLNSGGSEAARMQAAPLPHLSRVVSALVHLTLRQRKPPMGSKRLLSAILTAGALAFAQSSTPRNEKLASVEGMVTHSISGSLVNSTALLSTK
jgi:hypothetical protein